MSTPAGRNELVLYLDFDGVLHHQNVLWRPKRGAYLSAPPEFHLFQNVELLEKLLAPYPQVRIVLSTSWVLQYRYNGALKRLSLPLRQRTIGATYHSTMDRWNFAESPRGMQVWRDVLRRQPRDWLALDDDYLDWPIWCLDKYVRTHPEKGISEPEVTAELRRKLALMCNKSTS